MEEGVRDPVAAEVVRINAIARKEGLSAAVLTLAVAAALGFLISLRLPRSAT